MVLMNQASTILFYGFDEPSPILQKSELDESKPYRQTKPLHNMGLTLSLCQNRIRKM
jgi:hypothetical protein